MKSSHEYPVNARVPKAPFLVLNFSYYTLMTFLMMSPVILLFVLTLLLSTQSVIQSVSVRNKCVCSSLHMLCYGHVRSCVIHNSFATYDGTSFVLVALTRLIVSEPKY